MRPLLDAHTLIWALDDPSRLGPQAAIELKNRANQLLLSAGIIWELAIKVGLQKLSLSLSYRHWMAKAIADLGSCSSAIRVSPCAQVTGVPCPGCQATSPHGLRLFRWACTLRCKVVCVK
jgi:PIN domain nuclease of toxin-antitoxin system